MGVFGSSNAGRGGVFESRLGAQVRLVPRSALVDIWITLEGANWAADCHVLRRLSKAILLIPSIPVQTYSSKFAP